MSPQLRYILLQAKQLPPPEQLQLISHLVHHRLPIQAAPEPAAIATVPVIPDSLALPDPQLLEFSAEILAYQQELSEASLSLD
jgi:hypothetical protein